MAFRVCFVSKLFSISPHSRAAKLTILSPVKNGCELELVALADGGVGGTFSWIPRVARAQAVTAGTA